MIVHKEVFDVVDSSKLSCYMQCPRRYFYKYILGWTPDTENVDLVFGSAWHIAKEHLLLHGCSNEEVLQAYQLSAAYYREKFPNPMTDDVRRPKTPEFLLKGLAEWATTFGETDRFTTLYTEVVGCVPMLGNVNIWFTLDAVLKSRDGFLYCFDHKTAGRALDDKAADKFKMSLQFSTYIHAMNCVFNPSDVWGLVCDHISFTKTKPPVCTRIPIRHGPEFMEDWLLTTQEWINRLLQDIDTLSYAPIYERPTMLPFLKNTESCGNFFGCPYIDLCLIWENPLDHIDEMPDSFRYEVWDPRAKSAKYRVSGKLIEQVEEKS